jgi:hypothetical protein
MPGISGHFLLKNIQQKITIAILTCFKQKAIKNFNNKLLEMLYVCTYIFIKELHYAITPVNR